MLTLHFQCAGGGEVFTLAWVNSGGTKSGKLFVHLLQQAGGEGLSDARCAISVHKGMKRGL